MLTVLLTSDVYQEMDTDGSGAIMIQEALLVVFAGADNPHISIVNTLIHLLLEKNQAAHNKVVAEVDAFFKTQTDQVSRKSITDQAEVQKLYAERLANKKDDDLEFLSLCWTEALRIEPPFNVTTSQRFTENVVLCKGTPNELAVKSH